MHMPHAKPGSRTLSNIKLKNRFFYAWQKGGRKWCHSYQLYINWLLLASYYKYSSYYTYSLVNFPYFSNIRTVQFKKIFLKVKQNQNDFFKPMFLPKNEQTNSILLLVDLFLFIFWKKVKTPKRHFEINWPLDILAAMFFSFNEWIEAPWFGSWFN